MKHIVFTVINDLTYDQRMDRICTALVDAGFKVTLVGRKKGDSIPLREKIYKQKRLNCIYESGKLFYLEYNIRLFFFLMRFSFQVISSVDLDTILPGYWVSRFRKKIRVFDAHEYFQEVPEVVDRKRVKRIWEWVGKSTIPHYQYCYTVNESLAEIFSEMYRTPFEVIRNVPYPDPPKAMESKIDLPETDKKILLYQGALNEGRGLEEAIKAMAYIEEAELWLAGEGDLSDALRTLAEELKLENKVRFLGYVLPETLKVISPKAFLGLNLLKNKGLNYYYSLANKFFDYMHAGVPSLNPDFPEYKMIISQFEVGILVDQLNPEEIAAHINRLIKDEPLYHSLKANTATASPHFHWDLEKIRLIQLYQRATKSEL